MKHPSLSQAEVRAREREKVQEDRQNIEAFEEQKEKLGEKLVLREQVKEPTTEIKFTAVLPYIKWLSEPICCCPLQYHVRSVFKSDTKHLNHTWCDLSMLLIHVNKMEWGIGFLVNVAKYTLLKLEGACMNRLRSTIGIYSSRELKFQPFLNMPIRPGIIHSGTRLSLLTDTLTGTLVELKRLFT